MTTEQEKYNTFYRMTESSFNEWVSQREPTDRIMFRVPFTIDFPVAKLLEWERKEKVDKKDGSKFTDSCRRYRMISHTGTEIGYRVQSPAVIARRGLCWVKTDSGDLLSIPCTYDIRNPEHAKFLDEYDRKIMLPACYEVMRQPGSYKIDTMDPINEFTEEVISSDEFKYALRSVRDKFSKFCRFPKKDKTTFDLKSPLRTIFFTPTDYAPKSDQENGSSMRCVVMFDPRSPPIEVTLKELEDLCAGFVIEGGKRVKKTPKGFECSPELNIIKLHVGSKLSNKAVCPSVFVSRFQEAPKMDSQEEKVKYFESTYASGDQYTIDTDISALIAGLRQTSINSSSSRVPEGSGFNPMGIDTGSSAAPLIGNVEGSFLSNVDKVSVPQIHYTHENNENTGNTSPATHHLPQQQPIPQPQQLPYSHAQGNAYVQMANVLPPPVQTGSILYPQMQFAQGPPQIPGLSLGMPSNIPGMGFPGQMNSNSSI